MSDKLKKNLRLIYNAVISTMLILTGILLMVACVNVYKIGDRPFTTENIAREFANISVFVWITLAITVIGAVLALAFPERAGKLRATVDKKVTLKRLLSRIDLSDAEDIKKEQKLCTGLRIGAAALSVALYVPATIHCLNMNNFTADYNESVMLASIWLLPTAFLVMGIAVAYVILEGMSVERQIAYAKAVIAKSGAKAAVISIDSEHYTNKIILGIRISVAALAVVFIVLGIFNDGMADVLSKAINICTECIGLG